MVDIDTRKIIDILESREIKAVVEWLKTYPNIDRCSFKRRFFKLCSSNKGSISKSNSSE